MDIIVNCTLHDVCVNGKVYDRIGPGFRLCGKEGDVFLEDGVMVQEPIQYTAVNVVAGYSRIIVSDLVGKFIKDRPDDERTKHFPNLTHVYSPNTNPKHVIRNEEGRIIECDSFTRHWRKEQDSKKE